jgi:glucan biosynthesis protein C
MATISIRAAEAALVQAVPRKSARLYFVDHLRAALVILVVLHHVAMVYGASAPFYYVEPPFDDPQAFKQLLVFVLFNQAWFMGAFFLLAGYFTPGSFDRKGPGSFLKERLLRLGIPLIVYTLVLNPIAELGVYLMPKTLTGITGSPTWADYPDLIGIGPLWFVAMLLTFSAGYIVWRTLTKDRGWFAASGSSLPGVGRMGVFVLALALASFLLRTTVPLGKTVNVFADFISFPTMAYFPQYLSFFVLGLIAARRDWLRTLPGTWGIVGFAAAALAGVILFPLAFSGEWFSLEITPALDNAMGDGHWQSAVYALWDSTFAVGMCLGLIPLFRRIFNGQGGLGRFLAQQSYAVYVIHIPIVVYLAYALRDVELDPVYKTSVAALVIVPACYAAAALVRRLPLASKVL